MASTNSLISANDFITLKQSLKSELTRRSNANSVGSMSNYNTSSWDYSITPSKSSKILKEHITKITQPIDAISGSNLTDSDAINATQLINATSKLAELSGKSTTAPASNTGCKSSCSGLCSSGCYSTCSGTCTGGCQGCTGTCNNTCTGGCKGSCSNTCSGSCDGCDGTCNGCTGSCDGCSGSCGGNCSNDCTLGCTTDCSGSCTAIYMF